MPRTKEQSQLMRAESREQILSAARRLFSENGYDFCQVADIARQADMSHGNIYWYFASKEEILKTILAEGFDRLSDIFTGVASQGGNGVEKLEALIASYVAFGRDQGGQEFLDILLSLTAKGGVERLKSLGFDLPRIGAAYHRSVNAIFAQAQAEGRATQALDADTLTTFFFSFFNGLMRTYSPEWVDIPLAVLREAVYRLTGVNPS